MRRLTNHGSEWLEPFRRDPVRHRITQPEGHAFDTWLIEGRDAPKPGPVVIQIHGGPHAAHGPTPWIEMLALADAGFHVLYPNPRGSSGYGEAMIIRNLDAVRASARNVVTPGWESARLLLKDDGMGFPSISRRSAPVRSCPCITISDWSIGPLKPAWPTRSASA